MARAIVRHSIEQGHVPVRAEIMRVLTAGGFEKTGTSTWEADVVDRHSIAATLKKVLDLLDGLPDGAMDHLWIYFDQPEVDGP